MRLLRSLCSHITSFTDDTQSPSSKRLSCYSLHHVFSIVYIWLEEKQKLYTFPPIIKAKSFLYTYYKQIELLYIDPNSHLIYYYTPKSRVFEELFIKTQQSINQTRNFLPFKLFYAAFDRTLSPGHIRMASEKLSIKTLIN